VIPINKLQLTKLKFTLKFNTQTYLPPFIGNTIRGALGHALYKHYPHICESIFKVESIKSIPNPIVISVPYPSNKHYKPGDTLSFYVTLLGSACDFKQDLEDAANFMCEGKLSTAQLINCQQIYNTEWTDEGAESIALCEKLSINFLTPTEIFVNGQLPDKLDFATFIDRIFVRISGVIDNYGEGEFTIPYNLVYNKPHIITECDLHTTHFKTNGQSVTGLLGQVHYYGDVTRYLPYIDLASQIHIGKKTSRACGEYSFEIY